MQDSKDSEERRNEFIDAAEKLFKENGIVDTTINAIVNEVDVAKGLFYYYFKSKDDVIEAISQKYNDVFNEMMQTSMNRTNYEDRLQQFVLNCTKSFRKLSSEIHGDVDLSQIGMRSIEEAKNASIEGLTRLLEEGNESGKFNFKQPRHYAALIVGGIFTLIEDDEATDEEIQDLIISLLKENSNVR